jgi:Holliday junction resolvase RusA-like endonuclease
MRIDPKRLEGMVRIPFRGKPKPRPRVDRSATHNPTEYTEWKQDVVDFLAGLHSQQLNIDFPMQLRVVFMSDSIYFQLYELENVKRPKYVQGDVDNLVGGLMDALQDTGVVVDDRWILDLEVAAWEET